MFAEYNWNFPKGTSPIEIEYEYVYRTTEPNKNSQLQLHPQSNWFG